MELRWVRLTDAVVAPLLAGLSEEYQSRYGSNDEMARAHPEEFEAPAGGFLVAVADGVTVAGGGFRQVSETVCEVKRMWTSPTHRRQGLAVRVLTALEDEAARRGYATLRLETGPNQPEAIAMYTSRGYHRIPIYGHYPEALAFEKELAS